MSADVMIGTELDFTKKPGWAALGIAVVTAITYGRVKNTYKLTTLRGGKVGANYTAAIRHEASILDHGSIVGKNKKAATKINDKKKEIEDKKYQAAKVAQQWFEAGDIVRVSSKGLRFTSWTIKVLEIDSVKGLIKGVCGEFSPLQVGSKMARASLAHDDTVITLVKKQGFDPKTDPAVQRLYERREIVANKRATTRAHREDIRNYFDGL